MQRQILVQRAGAALGRPDDVEIRQLPQRRGGEAPEPAQRQDVAGHGAPDPWMAAAEGGEGTVVAGPDPPMEAAIAQPRFARNPREMVRSCRGKNGKTCQKCWVNQGLHHF